jgi:Tfp pilus assembly protein PilP
MKLTTGILIVGLGLGTAFAQNPSIIDSTKAKLTAAQQQQTAASNAALAAANGQSSNVKSSNVQLSIAPAKPAQTKAVSAAQVQAASQGTAKLPAPAVSAPPAHQSAVPKTMAAKTAAAKPTAPAKAKTTTVVVKQPAQPKTAVAVEDKKTPVEPKKDEHTSISMAGGRRDPFVSPVVNRSMGGSGCSSGKRCLAVDQIALTGIVKADSGMIAIVINAMNKAYFLRENDPVFNGFVVKITGDSIIFKETLQDKLGKSFTREVTKKISTPAV